MDIDFFDPRLAPGTSAREGNGVKEYEAMELLGEIINSGRLRAFDLVEINPILDKGGRTVALGKKVMEKLFAEW